MKTKIRWAIKSLVFSLICIGSSSLAMATPFVTSPLPENIEGTGEIAELKVATQVWTGSGISEVTFKNEDLDLGAIHVAGPKEILEDFVAYINKLPQGTMPSDAILTELANSPANTSEPGPNKSLDQLKAMDKGELKSFIQDLISVHTLGVAEAGFCGVKAMVVGRTASSTINFQNDPSVRTDVCDPEGNLVNAHIYAKDSANLGSAVGLDFFAYDATKNDQGKYPTLTITGDGSHRPTIVVRSDVDSPTKTFDVLSGAVAVNTRLYTKVIKFDTAASLYAFSKAKFKSSSSKHSAISVATGIGTVYIDEAFPFNWMSNFNTNIILPPGEALAVKAPQVTLANGSVLISSSRSKDDHQKGSDGFNSVSAASGVGLSVGRIWRNVNLQNLDVTLGNEILLGVASSSYDNGNDISAYSAASAIGVAVASSEEIQTGEYSIFMKASDVTLGKNNILSSISTSEVESSEKAFSAAVVMGLAARCDYIDKTIVDELVVKLDDGNILTAIASSKRNNRNKNSDKTYSAVSVIGAAAQDGKSKSRNVVVNANGSQTMGALAYDSSPDNTEINLFGADNTDKVTGEGEFGHRIGIYADGSVTRDSTVNLVAAKMGGTLNLDGDGKVVISLANDLGKSFDGGWWGSRAYARAFALGEDFKIYIGGRVEGERETYDTPPNYGFTPKTNGYSNVMNVFGAIAPAKNTEAYDAWANFNEPGSGSDSEENVPCKCTRVQGSSLTVDSGWEVNVYGPIEGLQSINVRNGTLNTYGSLRNITIDGGTITAYGSSNNVGELHLKNGELLLGTCEDNRAAAALNDIAAKLQIVDSNGKLRHVSFNTATGEGESRRDYMDNFGKEGQLVLNDGDTVMFNFNSDENDPEVINVKEGSAGSFAHVKGFISVEGQRSGPAITFNGGQFRFYDEKTGQEQVPENANLLLVRCAGLEIGEVFADYGSIFNKKETLEDGTVVWEPYEYLKASFPYDKENVAENLKLRYFDGIGLALCGDDVIPSLPSFVRSGFPYGPGEGDNTQSCASGELASIVVSGVNLFRSAISPRLTDVKGNGNDPFILGVAGRTHRGQVNDFAYDSDLCGLVGGLDRLFKLDNGGYWRAGAAIGYIRGDTLFSGKGSGKEKSAEQGLYSLALFAAYENFDAKKLKLDISLCAGLGYGNNKLFRIDNDNNAFEGEMESHSGFISLEGIKNLVACNDVQVGLWLRADYNHIREKGYDEKTSPKATDRSGHISNTSFNFLNTVVGVNVESEIGSAPAKEGDRSTTAGSDSSLRLYMRAGWNWQPVRKHSKASAHVGALPNNPFTPTVGLASPHGAVLEAGFREKLNAHWDIVGQWTAFFSKNQTDNLFSFGAGYNF
ncbi:MAG: autotransporter outer membrane beta-barrel domain-containing protein [Puniceicoccales bacterium]|jgi:hypothetical protein|nr:autotransporter outer membrane beta-barrel domain-containing protein [Puniceicoccales bacterium]